MTRHTRPPLLMCCAALLSACATVAPLVPAVRVQRVVVPATVYLYPPRPTIPAPPWSQGQAALLLLGLEAALADREDRLDTVGRLMAEPAEHVDGH